MAIWEYLTKTKKVLKITEEGRKGHKYLEEHEPQEIEGVDRFLIGKVFEKEKKIIKEFDRHLVIGRADLLGEDTIYEYKFGGTVGYEGQLQSYMWLFGEKYYQGVILPLVADWTKEKPISLRKDKKVKVYERSRYCGEWEQKYEEAANDILYAIKRGSLKMFLGM